MRLVHGLRAATPKGLAIGSSYLGGFFAGYISHTANGVATHALIVAPAASGYNGKVAMQCKTTDTATTGTTSTYDGAANSANMNNASHPAGQYCEGLSIGGYTDWYLPALYELSIAYYNLKSTTQSNNTSFGTNNYSVPKRTANYTTGTPAQTSVAAFQSGGAESFLGSEIHWTSTQSSSSTSYNWVVALTNGAELEINKSSTYYVRAFRKVAV